MNFDELWLRFMAALYHQLTLHGVDKTLDAPATDHARIGADGEKAALLGSVISFMQWACARQLCEVRPLPPILPDPAPPLPQPFPDPQPWRPPLVPTTWCGTTGAGETQEVGP